MNRTKGKKVFLNRGHFKETNGSNKPCVPTLIQEEKREINRQRNSAEEISSQTSPAWKGTCLQD